MARTGNGVEVRPTSIRIKFVFEGKTHRHTLKMNGEPMAPTQGNIAHAQRLGKEIRNAIRSGTFTLAEFFPETAAAPQHSSAAPLTVGAQLDTWLAAQRLGHSTLAGYRSAVRFWKAAACSAAGARLGDLALRALRASHILTALVQHPHTGKTLNNYLSVLHCALQLAVADKLLPENPADHVKKATHQRKPPDPFTREEAERIIADIAAHYPEPVANLVDFWFHTGLRTSELVGLRWANVDFASGTVLVCEGIVRRVAKDSTKTDKARVVQLNSRALAALQRQRRHTQMADGLVFLKPEERLAGRRGPAPTHREWSNENAFATYWKPALRRLGLRYRRPYNCRHTYATMLLMSGRTPAWCARQLGHSVRVFLDIYAKWCDGEQNERELAGLEQWFTEGTEAAAPRATVRRARV